MSQEFRNYVPTRKRGILCVASPQEMEISRKMGAEMWRRFLEEKVSNHSASASTLPFLIRRCERQGVPYVLTACPGMGYAIQKGRDL